MHFGISLTTKLDLLIAISCRMFFHLRNYGVGGHYSLHHDHDAVIMHEVKPID